MRKREQPSGQHQRRTDRRDLVVVAAACVAVFSAGAWLGVYRAVARWINDTVPFSPADLEALLAVSLVGLGALAVLRWRQAGRERRLRQAAEENYRTLVEQVPAITYSWDATVPTGTQKPLFVSPQIEQILGYTPGEWMGSEHFWIDRIHPDDRERVIAASDASDRSGTPFVLEYRMLAKDGHTVWFRDEASVITDHRGRPQRAHGVMLDITERKQIEEQLTDAEDRYRTIVERVPAVSYVWDTSQEPGIAPAVYVSPQIERLLGYTSDEWIEDPTLWMARVHPDDLAGLLGAWKAATNMGSSFAADYRIFRKDGELRWVRDEAAAVVTGGSGQRAYQGVIIDITESRNTLREVELAEQRYRELLEHLPVVAYMVDEGIGGMSDVRDRWIGPGIEALTGYTTEEWHLEPTIWYRLTHPEDRETVVATWQEAVRTRTPFALEYRIITKDGRTVWVHDEAVMVERDGATYAEGVFADVTSRREAESQLRGAEERYRTLVEQLPTVVYIDSIDDESTALYISPQYERVFGFSPEQRLSDPGLWLRRVHPEDYARVVEESNRTNLTGEPFDIEYRWLHADGRTVWVHDQAQQVVGPDGAWVWQGTLTDVTEGKAAQEALHRRDRILQAAGLAAERFLRSPSWVDCIDEVLARVGEADSASRAFVFRNETLEDERLAMTKIFEWNAPGITPTLDKDYNARYPYADGYEDWQELLPKGAVLQGLRLQISPRQREWLEQEDVHSSLAVPVFVGGEWWGFIGLDQCDEEREWQVAEVEALRVVASTLGAAIGQIHAADRLTETENRYRTLIEQLPTATYMVSARSPRRTLYMSPQIEAILGYTPSEWTSDTWESLIHPDDAERVAAEDGRTNATGEHYSVEYRLRAREGRWVWVHDEARLIFDAAGAPSYWQGVRADITDRKEAEHQLREAEQRYRGLIESMPAITYIDTVDPSMRTLYASPQVEQITGFTAEEWVADTGLWTGRVSPDDLPWLMATLEVHNADGVPFDAEYRFQHKDGRWVWLQDSAIILRDHDGIPAFSQGVVFDITERKGAEEQLREAEARYRAIVEHVPAVIYVDAPDHSMRTIYISPHVFDLTGYTPEEWMADAGLWLKATHADDREDVAASYQRAITTQEPWNADYRVITRDGRTIWVHDEFTIIRDEAGGPRFVQGVIFDVTQRKLAEQALRDSEQREREAAERLRALDEMKNTFLAAVSHELRSPLTSILGLSLTLERTREMATVDRDDLLERLSANARKLDRLLKDLLDIDRLNRGIVEPQYRVTDVGALSRRVIESLDALADRAVHVQADRVMASVDPAKVERIVENLVVNAVRHTASDRTIWLSVVGDAGGVSISVDDDGPGVPETLRDAIFEPFRQGPAASPHAPGTGIGLSLVARFAELHGGRAWVEDRPGGGASFKVLLPGQPEQRSRVEPAHAGRIVDPEAPATRG